MVYLLRWLALQVIKYFSCFIIFMKGTDRTFMYLVSVQQVCGSTPANLTHAWWSTLWPTVANRQWHPATLFGGSVVMWALPKPLFGLMGDCFIYLFIYWLLLYYPLYCLQLYIGYHYIYWLPLNIGYHYILVTSIYSSPLNIEYHCITLYICYHYKLVTTIYWLPLYYPLY